MFGKNMLGRVAFSEVEGSLRDLLEKLGSEKGWGYLMVLKHLIREKHPWLKLPEFSIWETIELDTGLETADDFRCALSDGGFRVSDHASYILKQLAFAVAAEKTEVDLVDILVSQLGFKNGAYFDQILKRARELGLECLSPKAALQLRLQWRDQPSDDVVFIAMEPIPGLYGGQEVFSMGCSNSELRLDAIQSDTDRPWRAGIRLVFVRPRG